MLSKPHLINASLSCQEITHNGFVKPALWLQNFQVRYCPLSSQDTSGKGIGEGSLLAPKETGSPSPTLCLGRKQACCGFPSPGNQTLLFNSWVRTGLSGPGIDHLHDASQLSDLVLPPEPQTHKSSCLLDICIFSERAQHTIES